MVNFSAYLYLYILCVCTFYPNNLIYRVRRKRRHGPHVSMHRGCNKDKKKELELQHVIAQPAKAFRTISSLDDGFDSASDSDLGSTTGGYGEHSPEAGGLAPSRTGWCSVWPLLCCWSHVLPCGPGCFLDSYTWCTFLCAKDSENVSDTGVLWLGACRVFTSFLWYGTMATLIPKRGCMVRGEGTDGNPGWPSVNAHVLFRLWCDCRGCSRLFMQDGWTQENSASTAVMFHGFVFALPQLLMHVLSLQLASADIAQDIASTNVAVFFSRSGYSWSRSLHAHAFWESKD